MLRTLLKFRNADSTLDLNDSLSKFISKGIVMGGDVVPVPLSLSVDVTPFKLMGFDGMVVVETTDTETLAVVAGQTNVIVLKSQYVTNDDPIAAFEVVELSVYNARLDKDYLTVFAVVSPPLLATQVLAADISYQMRDVVDPLTRATVRGTLTSSGLLPTDNNRPGDSYLITSGLGDTPAAYVWNGVVWINISDSVIIGSLLNSHRNNLFSDEIHLTDDQADAALGTAGIPSITNKYVTDTDTRVPTQDENDALAGLPTAPIPSAANPYVTSEYAFAEPTAKDLIAPVGTYITVAPGEGPVYVGVGTTANALKYFQLYDETEQREYLDSTGAPIPLVNLYKSVIPLVQLIPSAEPTVIADNGFYTGTVYIQYTGTIDLNARLLYGQKKNLANIDRGALIKEGPRTAETTIETLLKFQELSGRQFTAVTPVDETNVVLREDINMARLYLNTTTSADLVVDNTGFQRLRQFPELAAEFPVAYGDEEIFAGAAFTVVTSAAGITAAFPAVLTPDEGSVAVLNYSTPAVLTSALPGHVVLDGDGNRYRILAVSTTGNGSLLIYTGVGAASYNNGIPLVSTTPSATLGKVVSGNNPRRIENQYDHGMSFYRNFIPVEGVESDSTYEELPPGGDDVASPDFTLIGQGLLPNQGNATGLIAGRPVYQVLPKKQGNRFDSRLKLIGNWKNDQLNYPNQAVAEVSSAGAGIEFTGYCTDLVLYTSVRADMPYGLRVFVDGAYNTQVLSSVTNISDAAALFLTDQQAKLNPIKLWLALSTTQTHTIRVEITQVGTGTVFPLFGVEAVFDAALREEKGRAFTTTDLVVTDTANTSIGVASNVGQNKGTRVTRYLDRTTGSRTSQNDTITPGSGTGNIALAPADTTIAFASIPNLADVVVGDVLRFAVKTTGFVDPTQYAYRAITSTASSAIQFTALGFSGPVSLEHAFRIPMSQPGGTPIVGASVSADEYEYLRFKVEDWDAGGTNEVANLTGVGNCATVLDDAHTSLVVYQGQIATSGLEGYTSGVQLAALAGTMSMQVWGTGLDLVFTGNQGPVTVDITIDGVFTYTLNLAGTGLERHSCFFKGSPQSHTVHLSNPSVVNRVVVSEWIVRDIKPSQVDGTVLADFEQMRKGAFLSNSAVYDTTASDFAATSLTGSMVTSTMGGVRVLDAVKTGVFTNGTTGTTDWEVVEDFTVANRFGRYLRTDRNLNASAKFTVLGSTLELYFLQAPDAGVFEIYIDGLLATTGNSFLDSSPNGAWFTQASAQVDLYNATSRVVRVVFANLTYGFHTVEIRSNGWPANGSSSGTFLYVLGVGECPEVGILAKRTYEDQSSNRLHFASFRDLRRFTTLLPEQAGLTASAEVATVAAPVVGGGWPNVLVTTFSELQTALVDFALGGVISIAQSIFLSSSITVPAGVMLLGRKGYSVLTVANGATITMGTDSELRDLTIEPDVLNTTGNLIEITGDRCEVEKVRFNVISATTVTCVRVTGSGNRMHRSVFDGVVGGTATGINYAGGIDNQDEDCIFL